MGLNDNSPTDSWDDWGATDDVTPQSSNTGDFDNSWNDLDGVPPSEEGEDDWSDWGDSSDTQSQSDNFIDKSDDWSNLGSQGQESFDNFDNQSSFDNTGAIQENAPVKFNLSSKKVAFILAGLIIFVAILFMGIDKIHIGKKDTTSNQQSIVQEQGSNEQNVQSNEQAQQQNVQNNDNSAVLVEIPSNTSLDYSGDILEANGTVKSKTKYVQGHQILYCITINLAFGSSSEDINYYCNYASFNAVSTGDIVVVSYQQVRDNYISINAISK